MIDRIERVSRPGLRIYRGKDELPKILGGMGTVIVSTPQGVMTDVRARASARAAKCCASSPERDHLQPSCKSHPYLPPKGVTATLNPQSVTIKGAKGSLSVALSSGVTVVKQDAVPRRARKAMRAAPASSRAPSARTLANMVLGVTRGYDRKLELVGVGFRAQVQGKNLNLTLGFSHPVVFPRLRASPIETLSLTEILLKGIDRQQVGQVAAVIRDIRPPEPYKGKGVRYANEQITLKEGKKKVARCAVYAYHEKIAARAPRGQDPRTHSRSRHGAPDGASHATPYLRAGV